MSIDVRIKRVYEPPEADDGLRVLVDRVWPRGKTREEVRADLWAKEVAPSHALRKWFGHDPSKWDEFKARYFRELAESGAAAELASAARAGRVTLLYSARDREHNQAAALREYLERG